MPQGNWKCSKCGGTITELPFVPRSEAGLTCRTCYAKGKNSEPAYSQQSAAEPTFNVASEAPDIPFDAELSSEPPPWSDMGLGEVAVSTEKTKIAGTWTCSSCGGAITSLPFTPKNTSNLKCLDCFKRSRG